MNKEPEFKEDSSRSISTSSDRASVLGTRISPLSFRAAQDQLASMVNEKRGAYVSCANVYSVTMAYDDPEFRNILNHADMVTADGMPIVWVLNLLGYPCERVHNDDLFLECCRRFPQWRLMLIGGREGQPEQVAEEALRRFPNIQIVGTHPTPVRPVSETDNQRILETIEVTRPDIVWAALGTPAQDQWMASMVERVNVPMVGCGSLFDLLSGRTRPAPEWMKRNGLQWLFRLAQEPKRLAGRYAYYNTRFVFAAARQLISDKANKNRE